MYITNGSSFAPLEPPKFALPSYHTFDTYTIFALKFTLLREDLFYLDLGLVPIPI